MIDLSTIQAALIAWWTGFGMQCQMRDNPREFVRPIAATEVAGTVTGACAYLKVIAARARGVDEIRYTENGSDPLLVDPEVTGNRELTISCMVESYKDSPDRHAVYLCERARTRLRMPTVELAFQVAGIGVIEATPTVDLAYTADDRIYSRASFDLRVNVNASETDDAADTIGTVVVTSDFKDPAGDSLPDANQMIEKVIDLDSV